MTPGESRLVARLTAAIDATLDGRGAPIVLDDVSSEIDPTLNELADAVDRLLRQARDARAFATALADGHLMVDGPRRNALADPLKALQASLRHLTWQAQEIAAGHLEHRVSFLGEFSLAFNQMIASLREKQRTDREAMEASRMAALGQLAGGIAHEVNSPLQYIDSDLRFLGGSTRTLIDVATAAGSLADQANDIPALGDAVSRLRDALAVADVEFLQTAVPEAELSALNGLTRIGTVVRAVMTFTTSGRTDVTPADLHQLMDDVLTITEAQWRSTATIERHYTTSLPPVLVRAGEIQDALLRLFSNATLAVKETTGARPGRIAITTENEADMVAMRIADSGPGVPPDLKDRIFEPFFTTRDVGQGMGLGLTICREVVARHGGSLSVENADEGGAVFTLRLPRSG